MTAFRRFGQFLMALTVITALATGARASDPKYLPGNTEWALTINIKQLLESPLATANKETLATFKTHIMDKLKDEGVAQILKDVGFDIFKDLHSVTIAGSGKEPEFALLQGSFDVDKLLAAAEGIGKKNADALKITKAGKLRILEITSPDAKRAFACFMDKKTLLACTTRDGLDAAIARADGSKQSALKKEFKAILETTNDKQSISVVATGSAIGKLAQGAPLPNADLGKKLDQGLQGIEALSFSLTAAKDIQFQLGVSAKDAAKAKELADGSNIGLFFIRSLAEQQAKKDEKLAPLVDIAKSLRVTTQGSNFLLRGEATVEAINQLLKNVPR
ncbi:MAG: hypothetical protein HY040_29040 [Planctomycetes bacterium]|nr:hypothetical protein [Planctomycetota bacterium]